MIRELLSSTPEGTLSNIEAAGDTFGVLVAKRPDLIDPGRMLDTILYMPGRELFVLASTGGIPTSTEQAMNDMSTRLLEDIRADCAKGEACDAETTALKGMIGETAGTILSIGIICSNACADCPMQLRQEL